jgi:hypothetical protein
MTDAEIIYRDFCEGEFSNDDLNDLDAAWIAYENEVGPIESGSVVEKLVLAAMQYALDRVQTN